MFIQQICIRNKVISHVNLLFCCLKEKQTFQPMLSADIKSVSVFNEGKQRTILNNITLEIEKGKIYSILGKNGSGKSTLIKSLTSLLPTALYEVNGKVLFGEMDLLTATEDLLQEIRKKNIRYVFQDAANSFRSSEKNKLLL